VNIRIFSRSLNVIDIYDTQDDAFVGIEFPAKTGEFPLAELVAALIAFDAKRSRRLSEIKDKGDE
jgi:hypothetical protein